MNNLHLANIRQELTTKGYTKIPKFFSLDDIDLMSQYVDEISSWEISDDKWMSWFKEREDGTMALSRIENFLDYHSKLKSLIFENKKNSIEKITDFLLNEESEIMKDRIIYKYPNSYGFQPHQDIYNVIYNLPESDMVIVGIFLDKTTIQNGCLKFSSGKHTDGVIPQDKNGVMLPHTYKDYIWDAVECEPGDIILFSNYAPHCSDINNSQDIRRTIYFPFQKKSSGLSRSEYYKRKRELFPPEKINFDINNLRAQNKIVFKA